MSVLLVDTGIWYGLLDDADSHHTKALALSQHIRSVHNIIGHLEKFAFPTRVQ